MEISAGTKFSSWQALNDTVMGGRSSGKCTVNPAGLEFNGTLVSEGGGFISARSPLYSPPLDLSGYQGFKLEIKGEGRKFKLAVGCADGLGGITNLIPGGLRWVTEFSTGVDGISSVDLPFSTLRPSIRAKPVGLPLKFDTTRVNRLQILHSKFADDGGLNPGYRDGSIHWQLIRISAYN
ncbi:CIA30 family protein [Cyanobium sp. WAJ14-Wanaka]|uniref:CIA30 family protein n=1 Tax=Cyanobium sp. WAJ14-Wanaka TaxID=2823725 RepID=UPI0020CFC52F|nr:CIA30 family protein [Cyanobium sp. WAJ14-Wanaka]MCP9774574.1 CIA30 family protein [Cyanobium sp. WAJ14-Wanaka]